MPKYAKTTTVSEERSKAEIEHLLRRFGAEAFMSSWDPTKAMIGFKLNGRTIRLILPFPDYKDFLLTPVKGLVRSNETQTETWEQAIRQRWRAMVLVIKAKLEAVDAGITTIEAEFMPNIMLPSGETVSDWLHPQLAALYERGQMPALLSPNPDSSKVKP